MKSAAGAAALAAKGGAKGAKAAKAKGGSQKYDDDGVGGTLSAAGAAKQLKEIAKNVKRQEAELVKQIREYYKTAPASAPEVASGGGAAAGAGSKKAPDVKVKRLKFSKQLHKKSKKGDYYQNVL